MSDGLPAIYDVTSLEVMAKHVANSRLFGLNPAQAFTLMLLAQSKGLHPIQAMERYHVVKDKPTMKAEAMLAEFQARGGNVEWTKDSDAEVEGLFTHATHAPKGNVSGFSLADAKRAELLSNSMWAKYPNNMLRARVISNGIRKTMPGIIVGIYTPEEVADFDRTAPRNPVETTAVVAALETTAVSSTFARKDPRRFGRFIDDGVGKINAAMRMEYPDAAEVVDSPGVARYVLSLAVSGGDLADPGAVSEGLAAKLLDDLYKDDAHYAWMRRAVKQHLDDEAQSARERILQDTHGDSYLDADADDVAVGASTTREPGEEG